jgi:hypothetical protein
MKKTIELQRAVVALKGIRLRKFSAKELGFPGIKKDGDGDLTRFIARWRLAANFHSVGVSGFALRTVNGYAGILKLVLTVNAAEQFARARGKGKHPLKHLHDAVSAPLPIIPWSMSSRRLCEMLHLHLKPEMRDKIQNCLQEERIDVLAVAFGVRHLFVHGVLTAGANDADPASIGTLCRKLSDVILNFLENQFSKAVEEKCAQVPL